MLVGSPTVTNVPRCWGVSKVGKEGCTCGRQGVYEKSRNLPFSFAIKSSLKKKAFKKHTVPFK